ncbi:S-layer homology domain-containing protein [Pleurocapsales cyanobacterium LEGE 10410]|nr:S-layer homology domain-containing protein [Pleurocapsales cyanobacterium LEGE 10410]
MTNSSPPEPQNPTPERRTRPASGVTFDEMIAIIVAFSAIGAILFWSLGGRRGRFASDFGLGSDGGLLTSDRILDTGLGLGSTVLADPDENVRFNRDLELENRRLAARLGELESLAYIPPSRAAELDLSEVSERSYEFDSGARLVPLTGIATLPGARTDAEPRIIPERAVPTEPEASVPQETEVEAEPEASVPQETTIPADITPNYWAYPFIKQIGEQALVPEIARNRNFEPDTLITRASMATLISQAFNTLPLTDNVKTFQDVTNQNAIAEDIDQAVRLGFMQGYSANEFRPLENIPRYQVLVTLATGLGLRPSQDAEQILQQFEDNDSVPNWARQQVAAAVEAGLLVNRPDFTSNSLMPETPATRAEVAAMIHQALVETDRLEPVESEYVVNP